MKGIPLVAFLALPVGFCQHTQVQHTNYCKTFLPITWGAADTRLTKEQVDRHNRVWKRLCRTPKI